MGDTVQFNLDEEQKTETPDQPEVEQQADEQAENLETQQADDEQPEAQDPSKPKKRRGRPKKQDQFDFVERIDAQNRQISELTGHVTSLQKMLVEMQSRPPQQTPPQVEKPQVEMPTNEDWARDPNAAAQKIAAISARQAEEKIRKEYEAKLDQTNIQQRQQQAFRVAVQTYPELANDNDPMTLLANKIYTENGLDKVPNGPMFAATMAKQAMVMQQAQAAQQTQPHDQTYQPQHMASDSRTQRVNQGAMMQSGKHAPMNSNAAPSLTPEQRQFAANAGIDLSAYTASAKMLGILGGE